MEAVDLIPLDRITRLTLPTELQVAASWEEFLDILPACEYRLEYSDRQMRSFMGYATDRHEELVMWIGQLLVKMLSEGDYRFYGSNLALSPEGSQSYYNADLTVIQGAVHKRSLRPGIEAVTNPTLLVEVLSPSTYNYDLSRKLAVYREIPSVAQILYVDSSEMMVQSYTRLANEKGWLLRSFDQPTDEVAILAGKSFSLEQLYAKIDFGA